MDRLQIETPGRAQRVLNQIYRETGQRINASPLGVCPVEMSLNFLRLCHAQSCGKCVPCHVGLGTLAAMLESVLDGTAAPDTIDQIERTAAVIFDTADCAIGYEAARMVLRGVRAFREDYLAHIQHGRCSTPPRLAIPCMEVCPAHVDVPGYVALVKAGRCEDAVRLIRKDNPFPSVCGYVCEHPCEERCRRMMEDDAVNICGIKRYAVDHADPIAPLPKAEPTGKRVAVVGGGPGGLTAAYFLTLMGHETVVYEQQNALGGMLRYGIPDYRLPPDVLNRDIQYILDTGVSTKLETAIGTDITLDELKRQYDAVYISIGAHDDRKLGIPGENSENVISAIAMLRTLGQGETPDLTGKRVCVVGGGNVAMDATRTCLRLGAETVSCVYRRRIADMTALPDEISAAQAEGGRLLPLYAPASIEADADGRVAALWVQPQIIGPIGDDGRPSVRSAARAPVRLPCDYVIVAIGQAIHSQEFERSGISTRRGAIAAENSTFVPGSSNVFAGGDAVSGPATVILAVAAGKVAAANIDRFLGFHHVISTDVEVPPPQLTNTPACGRVELGNRNIDDIKGNFDLVSIGMTAEECQQECSRCLRCDHFGYGIFRGGRSAQW